MNPTYAVFFAVLAATLGGSTAQFNATCNPNAVPAMGNFNLQQILGTWYAQQFSAKLADDVSPPPYRCLVHEISSETGMYKINEIFQNVTGDSVSEAASYFVPAAQSDAIWEVEAQDGNVTTRTDAVYMHADYDSWGIQYLCTVIDNYRYESMIIMTRDRTPSQEVMDVLESISEGYGFMKENIVRIDQTNCSN